LHDNRTNETLWMSGVNKKVKPKKHEDTHIKEHGLQVIHVDDIGSVAIKTRVKPNPAIKALGKAIDRSRGLEDDDSVQPVKDVPDILGMQFVVLDEFSSKGNKVTKLMGQVKQVLIDNFGLTEADFEQKNT